MLKIDDRLSTKLTIPEIKEFSRFYFDNFFPEYYRGRISISITFISIKETQMDFLDRNWGRPRTFTINIYNRYSRMKQIQCLFHELTHVRQYYRGDLRVYAYRATTWMGVEYPPDEGPDYWRSPWEIEAYGLGICAWRLWVELNKKKNRKAP